ncbi:MAG TPA: serine/threonine-protein kinase [Kofleriaceae bacterium]|nr:serine/threonine-protein kinase [Kofleriaceae bacterium]
MTAPEFQLGDVVEGRYQIIRKLADGGMGTVYLAEHVLIRRRVALKLLHAELASDSAMVRRFMNEASAAGTLGHPHIVESTDMGFTRNGIPYIVFEYLEGTLLIEEVYRLGGLPVRRALQIASQIASALEAAHNAKIVHLDLKSDNVFLINRGEAVDHVKVLDFGISRFLESDLDGSQRGQLAGTPEFMAPEQVTMPDFVDGRADIYALGVLLYEMLCARCPHANRDRRQLLHQIVDEPPAPLDRPVPAELERLLFEKLLAKSRDDRLQTMGEVKAALDALATSLRAGASDTLFALEEPSIEIDIAFFDEPPAIEATDAVPLLAHASSSAPVSSPPPGSTSGPVSRSVSGPGSGPVSRPGSGPVSRPGSGPVSRSGSGPVPALVPATTRAPLNVGHRPRSWWAITGMLAGTAGGAFWIAEHAPLDMLGELRRASWAVGAVLVAVYMLAWMVYGVRAIGAWRARKA